MKYRLDTFLVQKGFFSDVKTAGGYILAGKVLVNDITITKPGIQISENETIRIRSSQQYVSRAGNKLKAALDYFKPSLVNAVCIDAGASTGGFTDALLQCGAAHVIAVDVAYGFLHPKLRADKRVTIFERKNICELNRDELKLIPRFFTADVSFTSLKNILPCILRLMHETETFSGIVLFKPQFELKKDEAGKLNKGVLYDETIIKRYLDEFKIYCESLKLTVTGTFKSPVKGRRGNQEFLVYLTSNLSENQP